MKPILICLILAAVMFIVLYLFQAPLWACAVAAVYVFAATLFTVGMLKVMGVGRTDK